MTRICTKCGGASFYKSNQCKECKKRMSKEYRKNNLEKCKKIIREWGEKNKDRKKQLAKEWDEKNKEKAKQSKKKWREKNKEYYVIYKEKNKEKLKKQAHIYVSTRRAREKTNIGVVSKDIVDRLKKLQKNKCVSCLCDISKHFHLDHIYPISKGGMHDDKNFQILCPTCNRQKNAKHPIDFMQEKGFLL